VPTFDWQWILALAAVIGAAAFLVIRGLRLVRGGKKPACGSCGSCPATPADQAASQSTGFVPLDSLVHKDVRS